MGTIPAVSAMLLLLSPEASADALARPGTPSSRSARPEPGVLTPAYRFAEGVSDGVYDVLRRDVLGNILPERLMRGLKAAPRRDSAPLFDQNLGEKEARYFDRVRLAYPGTGDESHPVDQAQLVAWRNWAASEQLSVALDAFKDTLIERYDLDGFELAARGYAKNRRDPGSMAAAGVIGGAFLYLNGIHATARLGALKLAVDAAPGLRLRSSLQSGREDRHLAALELGWRDSPLTVGSEWGSSGGGLRSERLSLHYRVRFGRGH